jgi:hypothetical protein
MRTITLTLLAVSLAGFFEFPAFAELSKLTDADRIDILALTDKVETAIINKDLKLLQECCDPYDGMWIDAGFGAGWVSPSPIIYYGWEQLPTLLRDKHLYFLGWADGSGFPVYGRAPEIIWQGRWQTREPSESTGVQSSWAFPFIMRRTSLPQIMQAYDGREVDAYTYPPSNMIFPWEDKYHFVQYFSAGEDGKPEEAYDNQFWFLLFDIRSEQPEPVWCLKGIAHLDGWGI